MKTATPTAKNKASQTARRKEIRAVKKALKRNEKNITRQEGLLIHLRRKAYAQWVEIGRQEELLILSRRAK